MSSLITIFDETLTIHPSTTIPTPSATPSTFSAPVPTYIPLGSCPDANNTLFTSTLAKNRNNDHSTSTTTSSPGLNFTTYCDVESPLTSLSSASTLSQAFVYSFDDCIEICASVNFWSRSSNCSVAVYEPKASRPANCWVGEADRVGYGELKEVVGVEVAILRE